jgi:hypothetical protein
MLKHYFDEAKDELKFSCPVLVEENPKRDLLNADCTIAL